MKVVTSRHRKAYIAKCRACGITPQLVDSETERCWDCQEREPQLPLTTIGGK